MFLKTKRLSISQFDQLFLSVTKLRMFSISGRLVRASEHEKASSIDKINVSIGE